MNNGDKVVTAYFVTAYALPMAGNALFQEHITTIYKIYPLTLGGVAEILVVYILFRLLSGGLIPRLPSIRLQGIRTFLKYVSGVYLRGRLLVGVAGIGLAVSYLLSGMNAFRYAGQGISEANSTLLLAVNVLNTIITVDLFYAIFTRREDSKASLTRRSLEDLLLSIVLVISANGTATMFLALVTVVHSLAPGMFKSLVFPSRRRAYLGAVSRTVAVIAVLVVVFATAWISGESIKSSASGVVSGGEAAGAVVERLLSDNEVVWNYLYYLTERLSIYYYSFLYTDGSSSEDLNYGSVTPLAFPIETLGFRLDYLLGGWLETPKPDVGSISRLNYVVLTSEEVTPRQGSSPGLLGSFNYIFPFPANIILCVVYIYGVANLVDGITRGYRSEPLSWFGALLALAFLQGLFQSPFDWLVVFDEAVVFVVLLVGVWLKQANCPRRLDGWVALVVRRAAANKIRVREAS